MNNNDKFHCPKCKLLFDSINHLPRILPNCSHSLCSYCISEQLQNSENTIICPIDHIQCQKISNINFFKENQNLILELQEFLDIPKNHNYEISQDDELFFDKSGIINSDKFSNTMNSINLNSSIISSSHYYNKKAKYIRNSLLEKNYQICSNHSLPLNIICIDERKKICSQCALNNEHVNHQIMTEIEFMNNIDNLIDIFHEVDNKKIKYLNFKNINTKSILDKIGNNIDNLIEMINNTKEDIIKKIKKQCEEIEQYLNKRKEEIFNKYQSTNFDISTLRESTLNWMQLVTNKLDKLNEIKEPSLECIKLLDDEQNNNIFNLISNGKQLNGRFNFIQETIKIIDKLEKFDENGISIKINNIFDKIFFEENIIEEKKESCIGSKENKEDENINLNINEEEAKINIDMEKQLIDNKNNNDIKSFLFDINENNELINSLHLTQYKFELLDNNKLFKTEKENSTIINKNTNIDNKTSYNQEKEIIKKEINDEKNNDNEIMLNLNIDEIKKEAKNEDSGNKNINSDDDNINKEKNNISKYIEDLSFNDDTLLINSLMLNQNDTVYHKKLKKDYPMEMKNQSKKKEKDNLLKQNSDNNLMLNSQKNKLEEKNKAITTKKIDLTELNNKKDNYKLQEEKNQKKVNNKNYKNFSTKNSFNLNMAKSVDNNINNEYDDNNNQNKMNDNNPINVNVINNNKNEIVINFTKKISGTKKNKPICSNYMKSEKKTIFGKNKNNEESSPIMISRSPGRLNCQSKLEGFYSFVPLEKINQKQMELNQYKSIHKTLLSSKDHLDINKNKLYSDKNSLKLSKNLDEETDINTEYSSNKNIRRNTLGIGKINKKMKTKNEYPNKMTKKINTKINSNENILIANKESEKYNILNKNKHNYKESYNTLISKNSIKNTNILENNNLLNNVNNNQNNNSQNINNINNNNNQFETKSKKELQEFIINQLKNKNPNFSRINMSGYGIQYLCSLLHKNPNVNYKEIKLLGCNLNDDDLFILTRTLLDHDIEVFILNLSSNKITDDSASNILDILKDCKSLKGLSLYNNSISNLLKDKLKDYVKLGRENFDMVQLYI